MAWRVQSVMDQCLCFIAACLRADGPMSGLCLRFEISRKTGYKWLSRYRDFGDRVAQAEADLGSAQIAGPFVAGPSGGCLASFQHDRGLFASRRAFEAAVTAGARSGPSQTLGGLPAIGPGGRPRAAQGKRDDQGRDDLPALFPPQV
jgi:hypothetical protein